MKIVRLMFLFALVSVFVLSCKETKKEEVKDDAAVEMTDDANDSNEEIEPESSDNDATSATGGDAAAGAAGAAATTEGDAVSKEPVTGIKTEAKELEEIDVPEGVIAEELADTPVVYPGCTGSAEEIRACNRKSFIEFIQGEFDKNIAPSLNLGGGDFEIRSFLHIDESGKMTAMKVVAPHESLVTEMKRVISKVPDVLPATEAGQPVGISFMLPVKFKVEI